MEVYLDESGIHDGSKLCVLAGYAGGARKLRNLEDRWCVLLRKFGIPENVGFHAKTFFRRKITGEYSHRYSGWNEQKASDFIIEAVQAINATELRAVGAAVEVAYFNSLPHNERKWLTGAEYDSKRGRFKSTGAPSRAYFFAFQQCVVAGTESADFNILVDFVMDQQKQFEGLAQQMFDQMRGFKGLSASAHLGRISFHSRSDRVGLQAADLLAHCMYHWEAYSEDTEHVDIRLAIHHILKGRFEVRKFDQQMIDHLMGQYPLNR